MKSITTDNFPMIINPAMVYKNIIMEHTIMVIFIIIYFKDMEY
jgi:hypothetical protein